jgi:hypothetical protein
MRVKTVSEWGLHSWREFSWLARVQLLRFAPTLTPDSME